MIRDISILSRTLSGVEGHQEDISTPLNVRSCTLSGVEGYILDISTPLNVRSRSLSGAEVNSSQTEAEETIKLTL